MGKPGEQGPGRIGGYPQGCSPTGDRCLGISDAEKSH